MKPGIGVITYNRMDRVLATLDALLSQTATPTVFVVADDGSTDGTCEAICAKHPDITLVTGANRGVCWNRNRALWMLHVVARCDVSILIEDDTAPMQHGWERDWISAGRNWGHANLDGTWFRHAARYGSGTLMDPRASHCVSGQCCSFSREAIDVVGYYDTRFQGYGGGHVEHTHRMVRAGFGGTVAWPIPASYEAWQRGERTFEPPDKPSALDIWLLNSPLHVAFDSSHGSPEATKRSEALVADTLRDTVHRMPWRTDADMVVFRSEIEAARNKSVPTPHFQAAPPMPDRALLWS